MGRVPITVMGYRCERCGHEWIPRNGGNLTPEPRVCPKCKSPWWNSPRKKATPMTYEEFRDAISKVLQIASRPMTWTEIRTEAKLPQKFPNNQWVHRLDCDSALVRERDAQGILRWSLPPARLRLD